MAMIDWLQGSYDICWNILMNALSDCEAFLLNRVVKIVDWSNRTQCNESSLIVLCCKYSNECHSQIAGKARVISNTLFTLPFNCNESKLRLHNYKCSVIGHARVPNREKYSELNKTSPTHLEVSAMLDHLR